MYRREKYRVVVQYLDEAVGRFPSNPEATRAHYQLADSYRQLSSLAQLRYLSKEKMSDEMRSQFLKEHRRWLGKAATQFEELAAQLERGENRGHLAADVEIQVPFIAADCLFDVGNYPEALNRYLLLAQRYHRQGVPEVRALGGAVKVYYAQQRPDLMRQRLEEIRAAVPTLPEKERPGWLEWLQMAGKRIPVANTEAASGQRPPA
jgi:hypothetical protein